MEIVVTGATGFIGRELVARLLARGDSVVALARDPEKARGRLLEKVEIMAWSPDEPNGEWAARVAGVNAVVNLAGEPVADKRWTSSQKERILGSRLNSTRAVVDAFKGASRPGRVLVNGSAIGYYGPRGDETLTEESASGGDFLACVVVRWEEQAARAQEQGVRVVLIRTGIVLGTTGGTLPKLMLPFKLFAGGVMGPAGQWVSWIHIDDEIGLILKSLDDASISGPVNATGPIPVPMAELSRAIGRALKRPVWAPCIPLAMKLALGERSQVLFASQRVEPQVALTAGYKFLYQDVDIALAALVS